MSVYKGLVCAGLVLACQTVDAGKIEFYENKSQGGDRIGTIPDRRGSRGSGTEYPLKKTFGWDNDEIKSLSMKWVTPGTRIQLFDSPSAS